MLEPGLDAGVLQPAGDGLTRSPLVPGIVGEVANREAEIDEIRLVVLKRLEHKLRCVGLCHGGFLVGCGATA